MKRSQILSIKTDINKIISILKMRHIAGAILCGEIKQEGRGINIEWVIDDNCIFFMLHV